MDKYDFREKVQERAEELALQLYEKEFEELQTEVQLEIWSEAEQDFISNQYDAVCMYYGDE